MVKIPWKLNRKIWNKLFFMPVVKNNEIPMAFVKGLRLLESPEFLLQLYIGLLEKYLYRIIVNGFSHLF